MKYLFVEIQCKMLEKGIFPRYKGSMLRGILGISLRNAVCMTKKTDCSQCLILRNCIFTKLFTASSQENNNVPQLAPPYCIEPPLDSKDVYNQNDVFSFKLKLFSYASEYLPYFIHALSLAGKRGMGKRTELGEGKFSIENIIYNRQNIYDSQEELLHSFKDETLKIPNFQIQECSMENNIPKKLEILEITFPVPIRFKQENRLSSELSFSQFINLITRRMKALWAIDGQEVWVDNYKEGMALAQDIKLVKNNLHWQDWTRYSGRQETKMQFGGLVGSITYEGDIDPFKEFLEFGSKVHLGKQTSFGLGLFEYSLKDKI